MSIFIEFYSGILFGCRDFKPTTEHPYWEVHLYIPFLCVIFTFPKIQ